MIKINVNYFVVDKLWDRLAYFFARGNPIRLAWDRFRWYWFPRLNIISKFPLSVDIETSLTCQLKCPMCTREQSPIFAAGGLMDFQLYKKIVDECAANRVFSLKLSWRGEPTAHPKLVDMVSYAKQKGIPDVAFLTHGGTLDEKMTRKLIDAGLDWISFSIDGLYETYESIRAPVTFEKIVQNVKRFHDIKKKENRKKPLVRIQTISSCFEKQPEYYEFWEPWVDRISVIAEQHRENPELIRHDPKYVCPSPFQRVFITFDGTVAPCHGDWFLHHKLGNVKDSSIKEIWKNDSFEQLRSLMRQHRRLETKGCSICPDGGQYIGDELKIGDRNVRIIRYLDKDPVESPS